MSIYIENLNKKFGKQQVLNNINLSINAGEIVGFLGPNGAGKSTTMKILTGYLKADSGIAKICDINVKDSPIEARQCIGYLPEHNPLYLDMYIREYLAFVAKIYGVDNIQKQVEMVIQRVGLTPEANKKIGALSKGYRQRVGLAQAIIHDPEVLILDEPTTGLDPNQLVDIRHLIKEIGKEKTILFSTHIMQEVEAICDRVVVINKGNIVADAKGNNIFQRLSNDKILLKVEFAHDINENDFKQTFQLDQLTKNAHGIYEIECTHDIRSEIFKYAVNTNNIILTMSRSEKNMEQIFRELTA